MELTQNQKYMIYALGGILAVVVLYRMYGTGIFAAIPPGVITDTQQNSRGDAGGALANVPGYTSYNMPPLIPTLPSDIAARDQSPAGTGSCCSNNNPCYAGGPLTSGDTFSSVSQLLDYYKSTNPYYIQLVQAQTEQYAALFQTGTSYSGNPSFQGLQSP